MAAACDRAGRAHDSVTLIGAAKAQPDERVQAAVAAGLQHVGENYLDDGLAHQQAVQDRVTWHFIGPIQSNKTRAVAEQFDWVHSLDRDKIARRLSAQRPVGLGPLQVLVQVNISGEDSKSGVAPQDLDAFCDAVTQHDNLVLRGLMAIPAPDDTTAHGRLQDAFQALAGRHARMDSLSLGMSDDLDTAVMHGATHVRIGRDLFGPRPQPATP